MLGSFKFAHLVSHARSAAVREAVLQRRGLQNIILTSEKLLWASHPGGSFWPCSNYIPPCNHSPSTFFSRVEVSLEITFVTKLTHFKSVSYRFKLFLSQLLCQYVRAISQAVQFTRP